MIARFAQGQRPRPLALYLLGGALGAALFGIAVVAMAAKPPNYAANLDQCRNGGVSSPQTSTQCTGPGSGNSGWVNGNAGASNAHYAEGESISYRARLSGFTAGDQVIVVFGYDVIHNQHYAIDYLTDKNGWQADEPTAPLDDPTSNVTVGSTMTPITITQPPGSINADPTKASTAGCINGTTGSPQPATSFGLQPASREIIEAFGVSGSPTMGYVGVTPNFANVGGGDQEQQFAVTFQAAGSNVVLAWGGHIASRLDWGCSNGPLSAGGISGSPYHMRILTMSVGGINTGIGNQDRSLSAAAVVPPPTIDVTKSVNPTTICADVSTSVTYTYSVHNTGTVAETVSISDDKLGNLTPDFITANGGSASLAAGVTRTFTKTVSLAASQTNIVTATGTSGSGTATDTATATVTAVTCGIDVSKSASPSPICSGTDNLVTFSYTVTNTGTQALTVAVSDDKVSGAQAAFEANNGNSAVLAGGASVSFTLTKSLSASQTNTVTATGTGLGQSFTDTATATVTAVTCGIDVSKSASPSPICSGTDNLVTFSYTVTNTGTQALTVAVSDDKVSGAQAAFEANNGNSAVLAGGASVSFTLTKSLSASQTNTVTATGTGLGQSFTDTATATVTANQCEHSQLLPTQTTCQDFATGNPTPENTVFYGVKANKINNVSPGVLFYYTTITATGSSLAFDIVQTNDQSGFPLFGVQSVSVFNSDCTARTATVTFPSAGVVHIVISGTTAGQSFIANIKIDPSTVVGHAPPSGDLLNFTYTTKTSPGGVTLTSASGTLQKRP